MRGVPVTEPDPVLAGRFIQFLLEWKAEQERIAAQGGLHVDEMVRGRSLGAGDPLAAQHGDQRSASAAQG